MTKNQSTNFPLANKTAVVTGAGSGLGEQIAKRLAAAGANVAVNDLNPNRADRVASEIAATGGTAVAIQADIANRFQCVHLIETTRTNFGSLDILINKASISPRAPLLTMQEWEWDRVIDVNLKGTFLMMQLCGRVMSDENKHSVIINVSSLAAQTPAADQAAYAASKAGLIALSQAAAAALPTVRVYPLIPTANLAQTAQITLGLCQQKQPPPSGQVVNCAKSPSPKR